MPRVSRINIKSSFFHIITQGINKEYIFENTEDIEYYIKTMWDLKEEYEINIIAYCIMNNHTHTLIETEKSSELSKYMQRLNTKYAKYYNKKYERVGYVFRDRYKSEGIYSRRHLYNCIKYIYNNPVKAGICDKAEDYPYSHYKKMEMNDYDEQYVFLDVDRDDGEMCKNIIKAFLMKNKIELSDLREDKRNLKELITLLKEKYNISLRKIATVVNMNRESIRKIYNK